MSARTTDEIRTARTGLLSQIGNLRTLRDGYRARAVREVENLVADAEVTDADIAAALARVGVLNESACDLNRIIIEIERTGA